MSTKTNLLFWSFAETSQLFFFLTVAHQWTTKPPGPLNWPGPGTALLVVPAYCQEIKSLNPGNGIAFCGWEAREKKLAFSLWGCVSHSDATQSWVSASSCRQKRANTLHTSMLCCLKRCTWSAGGWKLEGDQTEQGGKNHDSERVHNPKFPRDMFIHLELCILFCSLGKCWNLIIHFQLV